MSRPDGMVRELDQIYGFGYVRTALIRHTRTVAGPVPEADLHGWLDEQRQRDKEGRFLSPCPRS